MRGYVHGQAGPRKDAGQMTKTNILVFLDDHETLPAYRGRFQKTVIIYTRFVILIYLSIIYNICDSTNAHLQSNDPRRIIRWSHKDF